jgi:hypothetical protein
MTRKEKMELILSKVAEDKKEEMITEIREADTKEKRTEVLKKYGVLLTEEEFEAVTQEDSNEISDEELDEAAGGCVCICCAHNSPTVCGFPR